MPKRSRSRSPPGDNKNIIKMLKKLERRMDNLEKHNPRSTRSSSDYDSSLERRHRRRVRGRVFSTSDTSSDRVSNEEEEEPHEASRGQESTSNTPDNGISASIPPSTLNEDILSVLGGELGTTKVYGPPIHQQLADRWLHIFKSGMDCERRKDLIAKYPAPANSRFFEAPKLNPMVTQAINESVIKRDERLSTKQVQIGVSLSAIGSVISDLLEKQGGGEDHKAIIERLSDAGRLLSDLHHSESSTRRDLVSLNLNKEWRDTLSQSVSDEWLFGEDLEDRLKNAKNIQQSSKQLKVNRPPLKKVFNAGGSLNSKSPLKRFRGATQSGRYQHQVPSTKSYQRDRPRRQERNTAERRYRRK